MGEEYSKTGHTRVLYANSLIGGSLVRMFLLMKPRVF